MSSETEIRSIFTAGGVALPTHSPSTKLLLVAGPHELIKVFDTTDETKEPVIVDTIPDVTAIKAIDERRFVVSGKAGEVKLYRLKGDEAKDEGTIVRSLLPIRDLSLTHDGKMLACAGDDSEVQIVDLDDPSRVIKINVPDQVHSVSYCSNFQILSLSLSNGEVHFYDLLSESPSLIKVIKGEIVRALYQDDEPEEEDNIIATRVAWSPKGDQFAIASSSKLIKLFSRSQDYKQTHSFPNLHSSSLVDLLYDFSGSYLASLDLQGKLVIWDTIKREALVEKTFPKLLRSLSWGKGTPGKLNLICGAEQGEILILKDIIEDKSKAKAKVPRRELSEMEEILASHEAEAEDEDGEEADDINMDSEVSHDEGDGEDLQGFINDADGDEPIDDDDEANSAIRRGYGLESDAVDHEDDDNDDEEGLFVDSTSKKRKPYPSTYSLPAAKRHRPAAATNYASASVEPYRHIPYSAGSTPFGSSNKRFLTMNAIGHVHTVKQTEFSSISVSFFDQSENRGYHFEDYDNCDLAALSSDGVLVGVSSKKMVSVERKERDQLDDDDEEQEGGEEVRKVKYQGIISYKPHSRNPSEEWIKRIPLTSADEIITTVSVSSNIIFVGTSFGFIRYFSIEGVPLHYEQTLPVIASAVNETHIFTILLQSNDSFVFNLHSLDKTCHQREQAIPLASHSLFTSSSYGPLKTLFFSTHGDPIIVTNDGLILALSQWRSPLQSTWIPIFNTQETLSEMGGRHVSELFVWPLGLHYDEITLIVSRNVEGFPVAPLPLPDVMKAKLHVTSAALNDNGSANDDELKVIEQEEILIRSRTFGGLLESALSEHGEVYETDSAQLQEYNTGLERSILTLFSRACGEREYKRAWSLVLYLKDLSTVRLALKMAERVGATELMKRIGKLIERRELEQEEELEEAFE